MARYIDADIAIAKLKDFSNDYYRINAIERAFGVDDAMFIIIDAPTADVEKVKHGKYDDKDFCTICGSALPTDHRLDYIAKSEVRYCYYCGAKMDDKTE